LSDRIFIYTRKLYLIGQKPHVIKNQTSFPFFLYMIQYIFFKSAGNYRPREYTFFRQWLLMTVIFR